MKKVKILFIATCILALSSCKKDFLDLNVNPNFPLLVPSNTLLPAALFKTASYIVHPSMSNPCLWMGYMGFSPNYAVAEDSRNYVLINATGQNVFRDLFQNAYDYNKMSNFAQAENNRGLNGIGIVMKCMLMQYLVDVYNNVPYSQAFLETANQTPGYDDAKTIYEKIYDELGVAIAKLQAALPEDFPDKNKDLVFGSSGSPANMWIKFANTVRLRILLRQSGLASRAAYIAGKIATDFPNGLASFLQAGETAKINPGYTNSENQQNPYWSVFGFSTSGAVNNPIFVAGQYAVNFYVGQSDLRAFYMYKPVANGSFFGSFFNGNEMGQQGPTTPGFSGLVNAGSATSSNNPDPYRAVSDAQIILSDFESLFLQSEAVQRGWFGGSAQALYNSAVLQSFTLGFGAGNASTYVSFLTPTADNNWALATDKIKLIITQKWAALNTINLFEGWTEYRRTGWPAVPLSSSPTRGSNHIPNRFLYPQRELDVNSANVPSSNAQTGKIWWMP